MKGSYCSGGPGSGGSSVAIGNYATSTIAGGPISGTKGGGGAGASSMFGVGGAGGSNAVGAACTIGYGAGGGGGAPHIRRGKWLFRISHNRMVAIT
jgi:hypothetical protein